MFFGKNRMVFVLLEAGADPTLLNFELFTSLHYAAWMGFLPYVQLIEALCIFAIFSQCYKLLKGMTTNYIDPSPISCIQSHYNTFNNQHEFLCLSKSNCTFWPFVYFLMKHSQANFSTNSCLSCTNGVIASYF